jgi:hypothetical protein
MLEAGLVRKDERGKLYLEPLCDAVLDDLDSTAGWRSADPLFELLDADLDALEEATRINAAMRSQALAAFGIDAVYTPARGDPMPVRDAIVMILPGGARRRSCFAPRLGTSGTPRAGWSPARGARPPARGERDSGAPGREGRPD